MSFFYIKPANRQTPIKRIFIFHNFFSAEMVSDQMALLRTFGLNASDLLDNLLSLRSSRLQESLRSSSG